MNIKKIFLAIFHSFTRFRYQIQLFGGKIKKLLPKLFTRFAYLYIIYFTELFRVPAL